MLYSLLRTVETHIRHYDVRLQVLRVVFMFSGGSLLLDVFS
jgi:hypothetical protein